MVVSGARAAADSLATPAVSLPTAADGDSITATNMRSNLVPHKSDALGVYFDYPENLDAPELIQSGGTTLTLLLGNGEISIHRTEVTPGLTLQELAQQRIEANTQASNGRIVSTDLGQLRLGGEDAWGTRRHFDSAAGRRDGIIYVVRKDGFEYWVGCLTKQGPPVIPWEAVAPVCQRVLETLKFAQP